MVAKSYVIIGRLIEVIYGRMMDFDLKIRKNKDIAGYSEAAIFHTFLFEIT
jgi:hypothetical protein